MTKSQRAAIVGGEVNLADSDTEAGETEPENKDDDEDCDSDGNPRPPAKQPLQKALRFHVQRRVNHPEDRLYE